MTPQQAVVLKGVLEMQQPPNAPYCLLRHPIRPLSAALAEVAASRYAYERWLKGRQSQSVEKGTQR